MRLAVVRKALRDVRGMAIGGGIAIFINVLLHASIYPSYGDSQSIQYPDAIKGLFGEAGSATSPEGYAGSYLLNVAVLLAVLATVAGTGATAGEEGAGTLDFLLSQPVARWRLLLGKATGLAIGLSVAALWCVPAFLLASASAEQGLSAWRLAAAGFSLIPFLLLFLALGLWAGAGLPSRALAGTATTAVVVVAYFLNALGAATDFLAIPREFSPFHWIDPSHVLLHGFDWLRSGAMLALAAVLFGLAAWSFERRDVFAGARGREIRFRWRRRGVEVGAGAPTTPAAVGGRLSGRFGLVYKAVRDMRGAALSGAAAALTFVLLDVLLYPSFRDAVKDFEYPAAIKGMLGEAGSIASPEGFMTAQFFNVTPLIFVAIAIIAGTAATAGEEVDGTLDLLLSQPLARRRLLLSKWVGISLVLMLATLVAVPGFAFARAMADMDLANGRFIAAEVNVLLLESVFLTFALLAGAICPSRSSAVALSVSAMVACYLLPTLAAASDFFDSAQTLSPFYWASAPHVLIHGFDWLRAGWLFVASAAFLSLALWRFERRDVAAGGREWSIRAVLPGARHPKQLPLPHPDV